MKTTTLVLLHLWLGHNDNAMVLLRFVEDTMKKALVLLRFVEDIGVGLVTEIGRTPDLILSHNLLRFLQRQLLIVEIQIGMR